MTYYSDDEGCDERTLTCIGHASVGKLLLVMMLLLMMMVMMVIVKVIEK